MLIKLICLRHWYYKILKFYSLIPNQKPLQNKLVFIATYSVKFILILILFTKKKKINKTVE